MSLVTVGDKYFNVPTDHKPYWHDRGNHDLCRLREARARSVFADAKNAIDLGGLIGGLICEFDGIAKRLAWNLLSWIKPIRRHVTDVELVIGGVSAIDAPGPFDLVISNQTTEPFDRPPEFVEKLPTPSRGLIVWTTYEARQGILQGHSREPIGHERFQNGFPCEPGARTICHRATNRTLKPMIGALNQSRPAWARK